VALRRRELIDALEHSGRGSSSRRIGRMTACAGAMRGGAHHAVVVGAGHDEALMSRVETPQDVVHA
jgi:hypothetical protein